MVFFLSTPRDGNDHHVELRFDPPPHPAANRSVHLPAASPMDSMRSFGPVPGTAWVLDPVGAGTYPVASIAEFRVRCHETKQGTGVV